MTNYCGSSVTKPGAVFKDEYYASIAEVMSWASSRQSTPVEDDAYSLMGLSVCTWPSSTGEGSNAFMRLQQEIISRCDDEGIFTWKLCDERYPTTRKPTQFGLLSTSVKSFKDCRWRLPETMESSFVWNSARPSYVMTNKGLYIEPLVQADKGSSLSADESYWTFTRSRTKGSQKHGRCLSTAGVLRRMAFAPARALFCGCRWVLTAFERLVSALVS